MKWNKLLLTLKGRWQGARISKSFPLPHKRSVLGVSLLVLAYQGVHPHPDEIDTDLCDWSASGIYQL